MAILLRHVNEPIAPVKSIRPEVDQRISDWIERLLVKEPGQRTQNAQDAWDDFEEIVLGLLGPRWRREARLVEKVDESDGAKPLTPAPFQGTSAGGEASEEFKSFAWGAPAGDTGAQAAPPMWTPPPSESTPSIPDPVVGPPTPMPSQAVPAPAPPEADPEPVADSGFVTFGQPAPAPPTDALVKPAPAPEPEPVAEVAAPEPVVEEEPAKAFETYVAPPPSRPPTSEPALTPAPVEAVEPAPAPPVPEPVAYTPPAPEPVVADTMMPSSLPTSPPKPPKVKAPAGESGGRPKWIIPAAIVGGVVAIAVIAIVALGGGGGGEDPQPTAGGAAAQQSPAVDLSSQGIALTVPAGWGERGEVPEIPGLSGAASAGGPNGGAVVFGKPDDSASNPTLLSDDLREAAGDPLPEKTIVDIGGGAQAVRYANLKIGDGNTATVYAAPTSAGVATLACTAEDATCDEIAASMEITEGEAFAAGPSETFQGDVERILARLEKAERTAASRLKAARQRTTQAAATSRLATAYAGAAAALGKLDVSPADATLKDDLADSLGAAGDAYRKAAAEARAKDRNGYQKQGSRAVAAGGGIGDAIDGFGAAGYQLNAKNAAAVTRLPTLIKDKPKVTKPKASTPSTQQTQPQQQQTQPQQQQTQPQQTQPQQTQPQQTQPQQTQPTQPKPESGGNDGVSGGGEG
jgi:hypothetical protein